MKLKKENYEAKIENRDVIIANFQKKIDELKAENLAVYEENKDLRIENEEQKSLIKVIQEFFSSNKYNNEKVVLNKIKELVNDWQSN